MIWGQVVEPLDKNLINDRRLADWIESGRFPHALIVEGPGGEALARRLGAVILCTGTPKPCGHCNHCMKSAKGIHPDFLVYEGDGGARSFHIQQVRDLRAEAWVAPNDGDAKAFLLKNAQNMTLQAQNALLKVLEEPPTGVYFIITCENAHQLLVTIRSRSTVLKVDRGQEPPPSSPEEEELAAVAAQFWQQMQQGKELEGAGLVSRFERDKEGFRQFLSSLYQVVSTQQIGGGTPPFLLPTLQALKILDIIEEIIHSVDYNVNMLLLVNLLPSRIGKIVRNR